MSQAVNQDHGAEGLLKAVEEPLRSALREHRTALEQGGVVQRRANGRFRLRFREYDEHFGCRRHRSISLGPDPETASAVERVVKRWKAIAREAQHRARQEALEQATAERLDENLLRLRQKLATTGGGGRDQKRKLISEMQDAMKAGPIEALRFVSSIRDHCPTKQGKPRKWRLW